MATIAFVIVLLHLLAGFGYGIYRISSGDSNHNDQAPV